MIRNDRVTRVNPYVTISKRCRREASELAMVFQLIDSTKELITPPKVSAMTFVLPTKVGSRFIHVSQALHGASLG
jgi:hypothetical protein